MFSQILDPTNNNYGITPYNSGQLPSANQVARPWVNKGKRIDSDDKKRLTGGDFQAIVNDATIKNQQAYQQLGMPRPGIGVEDNQSIIQAEAALTPEQQSELNKGLGMSPQELRLWEDRMADQFQTEKGLEARLDLREETQAAQRARQGLAESRRDENQDFQRRRVAMEDAARLQSGKDAGSWQSVIPGGGLIQKQHDLEREKFQFDKEMAERALQEQAAERNNLRTNNFLRQSAALSDARNATPTIRPSDQVALLNAFLRF